MRSNASEVQRGLRELAERARSIRLPEDLHSFTLTGAVRACVLHCRGLKLAQ